MRENYAIYKNKELQDSIIQEHIENRKTLNQISKDLKVSVKLIRKILKIRNIKTQFNTQHSRKFEIFNLNYFENIDNEFKAYYLGLFYADGNVSLNKNRIIIRLQERDGYILEKLNEDIYGGKRKLLFEKKGKNSHQNTIGLQICNSKMKTDLLTLGCIPQKSLILKFPTEEQVPKELIRHFIRGYFDGDGNIYRLIQNKKYIRPIIRFYSSKDFCKGISSYLNLILESCFSYFPDNKSKCWISRNTSRKTAVKFYNLIYRDAQIFLKRKKDKFEEIFKDRFYNNID